MYLLQKIGLLALYARHEFRGGAHFTASAPGAENPSYATVSKLCNAALYRLFTLADKSPTQKNVAGKTVGNICWRHLADRLTVERTYSTHKTGHSGVFWTGGRGNLFVNQIDQCRRQISASVNRRVVVADITLFFPQLFTAAWS